jgi:hypothetical protein
MALTLFAAVSVFADEEAPTSGEPLSESGFGQLLELVSSPTFPSLSGLIQPGEMGVLTDNQDNFSDNKVQLDLLSNNEVKILSDLQILSGISVNITISLGDGDCSGRTKKKADRQTKTGKSQKTRKRRRSKRH